MKTKKAIILTVLLFITLSNTFAKKLPTKTITIKRQDNTTITVKAEMAVKAQDRNHGFMERKKIPEGTGMMFVFEKDQILSFWMKNTPHPLSIAYIDSKGCIKNIFNMTPYSLSSIDSTVSVRYALEVPQGWFKKNKIQEGDYVSLDFVE